MPFPQLGCCTSWVQDCASGRTCRRGSERATQRQLSSARFVGAIAAGCRIEESLHSAMLAKTLPLLLLGACASTAQLPTADQPELAQMAQPYAQQLQAVGITRVISPGSGAMVRLETSYGSVYVRYPAVAEPS